MEIKEKNQRIRKINRLNDEIYCLSLRFERAKTQAEKAEIFALIEKKREELKAVERGES